MILKVEKSIILVWSAALSSTAHTPPPQYQAWSTSDSRSRLADYIISIIIIIIIRVSMVWQPPQSTTANILLKSLNHKTLEFL